MIESEVIDARVGDVHITPEQIGDVNIGTYGSGDYVLNTGNKIKAELITNNTVRIFDGVMVYGGLRDAVPVNKYYDITIDNGSQGKNRNDIIVRRYTKDDDAEKKARAVFTVVKGTPTDGTAADPDVSFTDIRAGALTHDMKLHRVRLEGLNIVAVEPLFDVLMPMSEQQAMLAELNSKSETVLSFESGWSSIEVNTIKRKSNTVEITIKALKSAALPAAGTLGTIPDGYRPSKEITIPAVVWTSTATNVGGSITIGTDGTVTFRQPGSASRWVIFHTLYNVL